MRHEPFAMCLILAGSLAVAAPAGAAGAEREHSDAISLLFARGFSFDPAVDDIVDERRIIDCVRRALLDRDPDRPVLGIEELRQQVFPTLPVAAVPRDPRYMDILLRTEDIRSRMRRAGLRYIAYIGGVTRTKGPAHTGFCFAGPGAAGCFALVRWDETARLGASIIDIDDPALGIRAMEAKDTSTAWLAIVGILPVGAPSNAKDVVCHDLGIQIGAHLHERTR